MRGACRRVQVLARDDANHMVALVHNGEVAEAQHDEEAVHARRGHVAAHRDRRRIHEGPALTGSRAEVVSMSSVKAMIARELIAVAVHTHKECRWMAGHVVLQLCCTLLQHSD